MTLTQLKVYIWQETYITSKADKCMKIALIHHFTKENSSLANLLEEFFTLKPSSHNSFYRDLAPMMSVNNEVSRIIEVIKPKIHVNDPADFQDDSENNEESSEPENEQFL